jgi:hypothetical protein
MRFPEDGVMKNLGPNRSFLKKKLCRFVAMETYRRLQNKWNENMVALKPKI